MKYTEEDYIKKCEELDVQFVSSHKEFHKRTIIEYICKKHIDKGVQHCDWGHFRVKKRSCPYCAGKYQTTEEVQSKVKNTDVQIISEYKGNEKPIECRCKKCGNKWTTLPKVLITNGSGCPVCGKIKASKAEMKTHSDFVKDLELANNNIEVIGEYKGTHRKIECRCKIDGTVWHGYPANLLNKSAGCPTCNMSMSEKTMIDILQKYSLNISLQHIIPECRYQLPLKFDAFDVDRKIAFEYNGEQHYIPIDFAGKGEEWAKAQLELTQNRDKAKKEYCDKNKIPIIIVPYWEKDNMEFFIINELKKIGVNVI